MKFTSRLQQVETLRKIVVDTIQTMIDRYAARPDYGWIDVKYDAITGKDFFDSDSPRGGAFVYSWIQGRGLEAIATHLRWFSRFSGIPTVDTNQLLSLGSTVSKNLVQAIQRGGNHATFLIGQHATSTTGNDEHYTMSDLFCARGVYAFFVDHGDNEQLNWARNYLKAVVRAIIAGNFSNDQQVVGQSQFKQFFDGRVSYAGHMIAIGAVTLLVRLERDIEAIGLGRTLVSHILDRHVHRVAGLGSYPEHTIVEWIGVDGSPARDDLGRVALDPGHALEFVGLTAQFVETLQHLALDDDTRHWIVDLLTQLRPLLQTNLAHGFRDPGGIVKNVDAETGELIQDSMPWWSLPETMRAIVLVEALTGGANWDSWSETWFSRCLAAFNENFRSPAIGEIALQTIDTRGVPVSIIPATPDLDPGYHTGLSLIDCYDHLAERLPLFIATREIDITPPVGTALSGHAARSGVSVAILDPLFARISLVTTPYQRQVFLSADLLEFGQYEVDRLRKELARRLETVPTHITICATHSHTAPPVIDLGALRADAEYIEQCLQRIVTGCPDLLDSWKPVQVDTVSVRVPFGINRRYFNRDTGKIRMHPNPDGDYDDEVICTVFRRLDGRIHTLWVLTAVHPTTLGVSYRLVSADYPGSLVRHVRRSLGEHVQVVPFTGACGDVRPYLVDSITGGFREGTPDDVDAIGAWVASALLSVITKLDPVGEVVPVSLSFRRWSVNLPFRSVPSVDELRSIRDGATSRLARAQALALTLDDFAQKHENPVWLAEAELVWVERLMQEKVLLDYATSECSLFSIGNSVVIYTIPGELFASVGKRIKKLFPQHPVMVIGYTNASVGYLPSADAVREGGYEVDEAFKFYGLPGPFTEEVESILINQPG